MAREISVSRLVTTSFVALSIVLCASSASRFSAEAAPSGSRSAGGKKSSNKIVIDEDELGEGGKGSSRLPGTLPNGAPRKMPELDTLSVTLPFSLRRNVGVTHIIDVAQSHSPGAFCDARSINEGTCDSISNKAESATRSRLLFHQQPTEASASAAADEAGGDALLPPSTPYYDRENSGLTLQHMLDTTDESFLVYIYDSLDVNSYRNAPLVDEAAAMLKGYVTTVGIDIRREDLNWLVGAWNIQITPSLRLLRPARMMATSRQALSSTETIVSTIGNSGSHIMNNLNTVSLSPSYSLYGGNKAPIDMAPAGNPTAMMRLDAWSPEAIKKFALSGGKSLDSENAIEDLKAGDEAADVVFDIIRGAHPLTYTSNAVLKMGSGKDKNQASATTSGIDAFVSDVLASPFYRRRAQVPKAVIVLFTEKDKSLANLFKAVALRYNNRAACITVNGKGKAPALAKAFGVTSFPSIAVVQPPQSSDQLSHMSLKESLITGRFSGEPRVPEDDGTKTIFELIHEYLYAKDQQRVRIFSPQEGSTLNINQIMNFVEAPREATASSASALALSQSSIVPAPVLHRLQRDATRDAYHYQQLRGSNLITPVGSQKDWVNLVFMHAGIVASGQHVGNPRAAPMITLGLVFTPEGGDNKVSDLIRQEIADVKGRLKDNYFVSLPKSKAKETLAFFKQNCLMPGEQGGSQISPTNTDVVFIYARLQPLHSSAATKAKETSSLAPNYVIDYSCRTPVNDEESAHLLSSAMRIDKAVHYGAKKGFVGFGGSEVPPPSFDWSKVPNPTF